jgi:hypothetical protein
MPTASPQEEHDTIGMLSRGLMGVWQFGQAEGGVTIDSPFGTR